MQLNEDDKAPSPWTGNFMSSPDPVNVADGGFSYDPAVYLPGPDGPTFAKLTGPVKSTRPKSRQRSLQRDSRFPPDPAASFRCQIYAATFSDEETKHGYQWPLGGIWHAQSNQLSKVSDDRHLG
jgi:hypothetical protein